VTSDRDVIHASGRHARKTMVVETPVVWLYVQAHQSIRIQQSADKLMLLRLRARFC